MPENTPQTYTPTPWKLPPSDHGNTIYASTNRTGECVSIVQTTNGVPEDRQAGNLAITVAAVNSYARHCGPNAIQCAEDDLLGQALDKLESGKELIETLMSSTRDEAVDFLVNNAGQIDSLLGEISNVLLNRSRLSTEQGVA